MYGAFSKYKFHLNKIEKDSNLAVLGHDNIDPDGLSSIFAKVLILHRLGFYNSTPLYGRKLEDPQNKAFKKELLERYNQIKDNALKNNAQKLPDIDIVEYTSNKNLEERAAGYPQHYQYFIFVDHHGKNCLWYNEGKIPEEKILTIMDHHNAASIPKPIFSSYKVAGSASSLIAELLLSGAESLFKEEEPLLKLVCSALYIGLQTDTDHMTRRMTNFDWKMSRYLFSRSEPSIISSFENFRWPREWANRFYKAGYNREVTDGNLVASVGKITDSSRILIPKTANRMDNEKRINNVFVFGYNEEQVIISIRSDNVGFDFHRFRDCFKGAAGGGSLGVGGVQIPLETILYSGNNDGSNNGGNNGSQRKPADLQPKEKKRKESSSSEEHIERCIKESIIEALRKYF